MWSHHEIQDKVRAFMMAMRPPQPLRYTPGLPDQALAKFRLQLITEEFFELLAACSVVRTGLQKQVEDAIESDFDSVDLPALADACTDLDYVVEGCRLTFGIDGPPILNVVHESNMKKLGGPLREDGKQMKPAGWKPPDVATELRKQGWRGG